MDKYISLLRTIQAFDEKWDMIHALISFHICGYVVFFFFFSAIFFAWTGG